MRLSTIAKYILLTVLSAGFTPALALTSPVSSPVNPYGELGAGVVDTPQDPTMQALTRAAGHKPADALNFSQSNSNYALGGAVGVQVSKHLGVEGGGYYFNDSALSGGSPSAIDTRNQQVKYKSWVGYLAMKAKTPIMKMLDVYAKVGAGYEHQNSALGLDEGGQLNPDGTAKTFHSWVPVFSVGLEDHLTKSLNLNVQYMHLADNWQLNDNGSNPNQGTSGDNKFAHKDIITMSLGYLFKL